MIPSMWWSNLLAYSAQVLALVAAGALLPFLFRIREPRTQLFYWQILLTACAVLPLLQPWEQPIVAFEAPAIVQEEALKGTPIPLRQWPRLEEAALLLLAAGAVARALWLGIGLWRLRKYRLDSEPLHTLPPAIEAARAQTGADATVCLTEDVEGPVTFGFLQPVILLPARFLELPFETQHAIACHEFLHVRRRDWLFSVCEEFLGILFWFHPAVWWLLSRIRLSREQVVDREVVALTDARDSYVAALLAVAGARLQPDLAPAPLFLRKRHLTQRIGSLLKEVSVSKRRLVSSYALFTAVLAGTAWLAVVSFPLRARPQIREAPRNAPADVKVEPGGQILHRRPVHYPPSAMQKRIEGMVTLEVSIDAEGNVVDARVISGPEELRRAALESVLQWHYAKDNSLPGRTQVTIDFRLPESGGAPPAPAPEIGPAASAQRQTFGTLEHIEVGGLPEPLRATLRARLSGFVGQPFSNTLAGEIAEAARSVDQHLAMAWRTDPVTKGTSLTLSLGEAGGPSPALEQMESLLPAPTGPRIRVGGAAQAQKVVENKRPEYPALARQARIQGVVRFLALIGTDGHIRRLVLQNGHPLLVPSAQEAVQGWVYAPTLLNGNPVEVITVIDVNYTLRE